MTMSIFAKGNSGETIECNPTENYVWLDIYHPEQGDIQVHLPPDQATALAEFLKAAALVAAYHRSE